MAVQSSAEGHSPRIGMPCSGVKPVEPRPPQRDRVASPRERRAEKQQVADVLRGSEAAPRSPNDADGTSDNEREANFPLPGKGLLQDDSRKNRDHQRHHPGEQCARMCRRPTGAVTVKASLGFPGQARDRYPAVVVVHGLGGYRDSNEGYVAAELRKAGFATLTYDSF